MSVPLQIDSYEDILDIPAYLRQPHVCISCGLEAECYINGECEECRDARLRDEATEYDEYKEYEHDRWEEDLERHEDSYLNSFSE